MRIFLWVLGLWIAPSVLYLLFTIVHYNVSNWIERRRDVKANERRFKPING